MPYPAKTNAPTILAAAIEHIERYGVETLSMRELAGQLGLSPRALYRYYPDRGALEAAIAAEGSHRLQSALAGATQGRSGTDALRQAAITYLAFAREHPALYSLVMSPQQMTPGLMQAKHDLWSLVVQIARESTGQAKAASAAVALWSFLHGFTQLEQANVLGEEKPRSGFEVGLEAFLSGL